MVDYFLLKVAVSLSNIKEEFWKVVSLVGYQVEVLRTPNWGGIL